LPKHDAPLPVVRDPSVFAESNCFRSFPQAFAHEFDAMAPTHRP
jgi:hypothetical protein